MPNTRHTRRNFGAEMGKQRNNGITLCTIIFFILTKLSNRHGSSWGRAARSPCDAND